MEVVGATESTRGTEMRRETKTTLPKSGGRRGAGLFLATSQPIALAIQNLYIHIYGRSPIKSIITIGSSAYFRLRRVL